ncbi:MAG: zinc ribbon domain-containing protein [Thermodesulfovibrio sp.]|nr:zinc ribbon domain-containing protein [Thermodesulfovibrio sp.]MDW7998604.1 zinc ribbon domain-containing protein [Thermodesulfovibrio sp.]
MPLYEYRCKECKRTFQILKPIIKRDEKEKCPHCGGQVTERLISQFMRTTGNCSDFVYSGG